MTRFKDFGTPQDSNREPLVFKLHDEEFICRPAIPGKTLLEFVKKSDSDRATDSAVAVEEFFKHVLIEESYERFESLARDPDRVVTMSTLGEIVSWVLEEYSDRPTQGSEL